MTTDARIVAKLLVRADQLDDYAAACRREGIVSGPEGAEDAELSRCGTLRAASGCAASMVG